MSTGLIVQSPGVSEILKELRYECVILDEAHRARRRNLGPSHRGEAAEFAATRWADRNWWRYPNKKYLGLVDSP